MATVRIIDRRKIGGMDTVAEIIERDGKVYEEQTKPVKYGTMSRRTASYPSYESYCDARDTGILQWSEWK